MEPPERDVKSEQLQREMREDVRKEYEEHKERKKRDNLDELLGGHATHYEDPEAGYYSKDDDEYDPLTNTTDRSEDIRAELRRGYRLTYSTASDLDLQVADAIIDLIESDGLLHSSIEELAMDLGVSERDLKRVQWQLTQTDPPGIGASSPQEALCAQLSYPPGHRAGPRSRSLRADSQRSLPPDSRGADFPYAPRAGRLFPSGRTGAPYDLRKPLPLPRRTAQRHTLRDRENSGHFRADVIIREHIDKEGKREYIAEVQDAGLPKLPHFPLVPGTPSTASRPGRLNSTPRKKSIFRATSTGLLVSGEPQHPFRHAPEGNRSADRNTTGIS